MHTNTHIIHINKKERINKDVHTYTIHINFNIDCQCLESACSLNSYGYAIIIPSRWQKLFRTPAILKPKNL